MAKQVGRDLYRRVVSINRMIAEGSTVTAACLTARTERRTYQRANAKLRNGAVVANSDVARRAARLDVGPTWRRDQLIYQRLYARWYKRRPAGMPAPRMRDNRALIRPEHLLLMSADEVAMLFGGNRDG